MPRANQLLIYHHDRNDGFDDELAVTGAASIETHTHGQVDSDGIGGGLTTRLFSNTAVIVGPLQPGEWEAVFADDGGLGGAMGAVISFCQTSTRVAADATDDALIGADLGINPSLRTLLFSVTPDKRYISFVASAAVNILYTLRRLKTA